MDILTERGRETVKQEREAVAIWSSWFPSISYVHTPKDRPVPIDAMLVKNGAIIGVVETKCRQMSREQFYDDYKCEWLVTFDKIIAARRVAAELSVPLIGFLYLVPDQLLLVQKIWSPDEGFAVSFFVDKTPTQATVNGGMAMRDNAYISMVEAKQYEFK
jgi:hypothetical protein